MAEEKKSAVPSDLAGLVENVFLMGIGVLEITKEKTNDLAEELIDRGKMSKSEAKEVADKIGEAAEKQQEVMRKAIAKETDRAMKTAGVATKADVEDLRSEMAEIKSLIKDMAGSGSAAAE